MQRVQSPAPNLVKRRLDVNTPNKIWVGATIAMRAKGERYLAVLLDLFTSRVVAWSIHATQATSLPMAGLDMALALAQRKLEARLIFYSEKVTVYGSNDYLELLQANSLQPSMSRKGNCWNNTVAESIFQT